MTQSSISSLCVLSAAAVLLLLTDSCGGEVLGGEEVSSQLTGPRQPIVATLGKDIVLPCRLDPPQDAFPIAFEWTRPDLNPRFVHVWRSGVNLDRIQHQFYERRTSVFINKLELGDVSLKLSKVKLSDVGQYRCFVPEWDTEALIVLLLGAASSPDVQVTKNTSGPVLHCESEGWYPEPEVSWLDGEGHVLSAGPPETVRGPDGLYTVSSRVTVEKRHGNRFTCRVHQKTTNQTRETQIHVPDEFLEVQSSSVVPVVAGLTVLILLILAAVFAVWTLRQRKTKTRTDHEDGKQGEEDKSNNSTYHGPESQSLLGRQRSAEEAVKGEAINGDRGKKRNVHEEQEKERKKERSQKLNNSVTQTKPGPEDGELINGPDMLTDTTSVGMNRENLSSRINESEGKPQTESQQSQAGKNRSTSTLTVAHGHHVRF